MTRSLFISFGAVKSTHIHCDSKGDVVALVQFANVASAASAVQTGSVIVLGGHASVKASHRRKK
jgi:hypothetical protein